MQEARSAAFAHIENDDDLADSVCEFSGRRRHALHVILGLEPRIQRAPTSAVADARDKPEHDGGGGDIAQATHPPKLRTKRRSAPASPHSASPLAWRLA